MAKIELGGELRDIESLIDAGNQAAASSRLAAVQQKFGRRPEYRYLRALFDASFHTRTDRELLREVMELVGEQPDLAEATALLAQLYSRTGDTRADLFAHEAMKSSSASARRRAARVLGTAEDAPDGPTIPSLPPLGPAFAVAPAAATAPRFEPPRAEVAPARLPTPAPPAPPLAHAFMAPGPAPVPDLPPPAMPFADPVDTPPARASSVPPPPPPAAYSIISSPPPRPRSAQPPAPSLPPPPTFPPPVSRSVPAAGLSAPPPPPTSGDWFEDARIHHVHRRTPLHGVKASTSTVDTLLELARAVAHGKTQLAPRPVPLDRSGLAEIDAALLAWRRSRAQAPGRKAEHGETMAAAAFLLAVVMHELQGVAIDTTTDDGGCKVAIPTGAGVRPILVANAFATGTGPSLLEAYDRLVHAAEVGGRRSSSMSFAAVRPALGEIAAVGRHPSNPAPAPHRSPTGSFDAHRPPSNVPPAHRGAPASVPPAHRGSPASAPPGRLPTPPPPAAAEQLSVSRQEAELATLRRLLHPVHPGSPPSVDLSAVAHAFATSSAGQEIASRSGRVELGTNPSGIEGLESYCVATRGVAGLGRERSHGEPSPQMEQEILSWGAFLGQTIIALYGGSWSCDPSAPTDARRFRVICNDRVVAWPMAEVYLRFRDGAAHDLIGYLAKIGQLLKA